MSGVAGSCRAGYALATLLVLTCALFASTASPASAAPAKPTIETIAPSSVGATIATLNARIDPNGEDTSYRFEYGATTSYGAVAPAGGTDIGAGMTSVNALVPIGGLTADGVYHYRVIATNSLGTTESEDETFGTFGVARFNASLLNADGTSDLYAGSHPYELSSEIKFAQDGTGSSAALAGSAKDFDLEMPAGLIGEPGAVPQCPARQLTNEEGGCPQDSQIGVVSLELEGLGDQTVPLYNLVPTEGTPAQFGAFVLILPLTLTAVIEPDKGYALNIDVKELTDLLGVKGISVKLWGVPGDPVHDSERGECLKEEEQKASCPSGAGNKPFLTMPTVCGAAPTFTLKVDSWSQPGEFTVLTSTGKEEAGAGSAPLTGCERLDFSPTLEVQSDTTTADSPASLGVSVGVPQNNDPDGVAEASLEGIVVKLPQGASINVGAADGLDSCTPAQVALRSSVLPSCPDASKIGTAQIGTPLLPVPLSGSIYLARPADPFDGVLGAYLVAEADGVQVKLAMRITPDPDTGQLTVTVSEAPQLEFAKLTLSFKGGPRALLATPATCGTFATTAQATSYSELVPGSQPTLSSDLRIDANCGGGFAPSLVAGATSTGAGEASGFTLQVGRPDGQQTLQSISTTLPEGLLAKLGSVPRCAEAQAATGTCASASQVGSVTIAAGAGSHPFYFSGNTFLTGQYEGAPFGLSIVVSAVAGPFDLGVVVIRARLQVNPRDARLTLITDSLPRILQGIPLRIKAVDVNVTRAGFMTNPTNCASKLVSASIASAQTTVQVSSPFAVTGCARLPFSPTVSATTQSYVSLKQGAALALDIKEPQGAHANIKTLRVVLPTQLSSRLSAIREACLSATFNRDPAVCPKASRIGSAEAHTTLLSGALHGPVYLVSNGGSGPAEFAVVLQGDGVTLEMLGALEVAGDGVLAVTFKAVPDASISSLGIDLPAGRDAVLGANNLFKASASQCGRKLVLHTTLGAQNGIQVKRSTRVSVNGCHAHRATSKRARRSSKRKRPRERRKG